MLNSKAQIVEGLRPLPKDSRDFNLGAIQERVDLYDIPQEFTVGEPIQKDQGNSDFCTAFAVTSASELQEAMELSAEWQFSEIKRLLGDWKGWGADLRTACASAVKAGSLSIYDFPELHPTFNNWRRDDFANWENWPDVSEKAEVHKKHSYFSITKGGYKSIFDAIRASLWVNKEAKRAVLVGALWRNEWTQAENGIIPESYGKEGFGHAFLFIGYKHVNGIPYLVAHLSNGTEIGDKGRFYFSESVVNREIGKYGIYMFQDLDAGTFKKEKWTLWQRIINFFNILLQ